MRFNNLIDRIFGSKPKIKILRAMLKTGVPLTGRKIAVLSGLNHRTCLLSLNALQYEGVVSVRSAGRSKIYVFNKDNIFIKKTVAMVFCDESDLLPSIFRKLWGKLKNKVSALILFGSIVEGKEAPDSDIDVCVVMRSSAGKNEIIKIIDREGDRILLEYGNEFAPYYVSESGFISRYKKKDRLITSIVENGKIMAGKRFY